jgi:hypothetical protein
MSRGRLLSTVFGAAAVASALVQPSMAQDASFVREPAAVPDFGAVAGTADARTISPLWGSIDPIWGTIDPIWGTIDPIWGTIDPIWGTIDPIWGTIDPIWGTIDPIWGTIDPIWGTIDPIWGTIDPIWGTIDPIWGTIDPIWGTIDPIWGTIDPIWGTIDPIWGTIDPIWGTIDPIWRTMGPIRRGSNIGAAPSIDLRGLRDAFISFYNSSERRWGSAIYAKTGRSFFESYASEILAKYKIDLGDPRTLLGLDALQRQKFYFDWFDGLNSFSGRDHADYWMITANWSPLLSRANGGGTGTQVGLIDFSLGSDEDILARLSGVTGYSVFGGGHGAAVASLIASAHDGRGVMGVVPGARLALGNPFDSSLTASWADVSSSLRSVLGPASEGLGASDGLRTSVVNLSIGVKGSTFHQDWLGVYADLARQSGLVSNLSNTVFVHGAGNDGSTQSGVIAWEAGLTPAFVVVGSVGPSGQVSSFSNRPGDACLSAGGGDSCSVYLKSRFLVAPGEWILTSDGQGGIARHSGTSFAAPLVTGAVSLLHSNWGWLKDKPHETLDILFRTATDLGAPGVDDVYGQGLLNIAAAMAPIDMRALKTLDPRLSGSERFLNARWNGSVAGGLWTAGGAYFVAYESLDPASNVALSGGSFRDFRVPLAAKISDTTRVFQSADENLLAYMADVSAGFIGARSVVLSSDVQGLEVLARVAPHPVGYQVRDGELPYRSAIDVVTPSGLAIHFGSGNGAPALAGDALAPAMRYDPRQGGANPVLGLASGGAFASVDVPLSDSVRVTYGLSQRTYDPILITPASPQEIRLYEGLDPYRAVAGTVGVVAALSSKLSLGASYTLLAEHQGVMGVRTLDDGVFLDRSRTDAVTVEGEFSLSERIRLSGSATAAQTRGRSGSSSLIGVSSEGLVSTAFEASIELDRVMHEGDRAKIALVQPLHFESGRLLSTGLEVFDRETGSLAQVSRDFDLDVANRRLALEAVYSAPVLRGRGELSAFARREFGSETQGSVPYPQSIIGAAFSVGF